MVRKNSTTHWALYELARLETPGDPWHTTKDISDNKPSPTKSEHISIGLRQTFESDLTDRVRTDSVREYAYRLNKSGKDELQSLGTPTRTPGQDGEDIDDLEMPESVYEPAQTDIRFRPGFSPSEALSGSVDIDRDDDYLFVSNWHVGGGRRHVYEPIGDGDTMDKRCNSLGNHETTDIETDIVLMSVEDFQSLDSACSHCRSSAKYRAHSGELPSPSELVETLSEYVDSEEGYPGEEDITAEEAASRSRTPDWEWLSNELDEAGHPELSKKAANKDLTADEVRNEVFDILLSHQEENETSTPL